MSLTPLINIHSRISPQIFKKIWNGPNGILRGPGDTDLWKKSDVENLVSDSISVEWNTRWHSWVSLMMEGGRLKAEGNLIRLSTRSIHISGSSRWARSRKKYCTSLKQGTTVRNSVIFKSTSVADPGPRPDIFGPPGSGAGSVSRRYGSGFGPFCRKDSKKKFVSYSFLTFYDFLSVKNDVIKMYLVP